MTSGGRPEQKHPGGRGRCSTQHPRDPLSHVLELPHAWVWGGEVGWGVCCALQAVVPQPQMEGWQGRGAPTVGRLD